MINRGAIISYISPLMYMNNPLRKQTGDSLQQQIAHVYDSALLHGGRDSSRDHGR